MQVVRRKALAFVGLPDAVRNRLPRSNLPIVFGLLGTVFLAACFGSGGARAESQPKKGGTINVALSDEPVTLDVTTTRSDITATLSYHLFETLFALDAKYRPQPMLVEKYEQSPDGTKYTLVLREGVFFHDGTPLKSNDVVASLSRFIKLTPVGQTNLGDAKIVAKDDRTVSIEFSSPRGNLLSALSDLQAVIYPASVLESAAAGPIPTNKIIGTGPYKFASWKPGVELVLSRSEKYTPSTLPSSGLSGVKSAYADRLRFVAVPNAAARIASVEAGDYQFAAQFGGDDAQLIEAAPSLKVIRMRFGKLMLINKVTRPPLDNVAVRRAIMVGLNIKAFGQVLGHSDNWNISPSILPSDVPISSAAGAADFNKGNVAEAKRLLKEAGYDGTPITIITANHTTTQSQAVIMKEQLEAMGIPTKVEPLELTVLQTRRRDPNAAWNMAVGQVGGQTDILQTTFLPCGNRESYFCEKEVDGALLDFASAIGPDARQAAYDRVQELYYKYIPAYLTAEFWNVYAVNESLHGFKGENWPVLWNAWVDQKQ